MSSAVHSDLAAQLSGFLDRVKLLQRPAGTEQRWKRGFVMIAVVMTYLGQTVSVVAFTFLALYLLRAALPVWAWLLVFAAWTTLAVFVVQRQARFVLATTKLQRRILLDNVVMSIACTVAFALSIVLLLGI